VGFDHPATSNAGRADAKSLVGSVNNCTNPLKVGVPAALGDVMSVADIVAKKWAPAANIATGCHD
jgi:hypothetical protein